MKKAWLFLHPEVFAILTWHICTCYIEYFLKEFLNHWRCYLDWNIHSKILLEYYFPRMIRSCFFYHIDKDIFNLSHCGNCLQVIIWIYFADWNNGISVKVRMFENIQSVFKSFGTAGLIKLGRTWFFFFLGKCGNL